MKRYGKACQGSQVTLNSVQNEGHQTISMGYYSTDLGVFEYDNSCVPGKDKTGEIYCEGKYSCYEATVNNNYTSMIACSADHSCLELVVVNIDLLLCTAYRYGLILFLLLNNFCVFFLLMFFIFDVNTICKQNVFFVLNFETVVCSGCRKGTIVNVADIWVTGDYGAWDSNIIMDTVHYTSTSENDSGENNVMNVYFLAYRSGDGAVIYCASNHFCNIVEL